MNEIVVERALPVRHEVLGHILGERIYEVRPDPAGGPGFRCLYPLHRD